MSELPPPPFINKTEIPPPPALTEVRPAPTSPTKEAPKTVADKLRERGGRTFLSGKMWVARYGRQNEVGKTEDEAAGKLLAKLR